MFAELGADGPATTLVAGFMVARPWRVLLVASGLALSAILALQWLPGPPPADEAGIAPMPGTLPDRDSPGAEKPVGQGVATNGGASPKAPRAGWTPVDIDAVDPLLVPEYKERVAGAVLVEVAEDIRDWQAGERISFTVPQIGMTYTPVIDRIETALGHNRSYFGRLTATTSPYTFVITAGERNTFASITTPAGTFELVGNARLGWLMPTANMDQHVDYGKPDYIVPELEVNVL